MKRMMVLLASVLVLTACTQPEKKVQGGNRKKNGVNHKSNLVC